MDFFELIDRVKYYAGRYAIAGVFLILGIALLAFGLKPDAHELNNGKIEYVSQNKIFIIASIFFLAASVIWILYLLGVINTKISYAIVAMTAVSGAILIYMDYNSVQSTVAFNEAVEVRNNNIKSRLDDVKQAELEYKELHGTYTDDMDALIEFVKTGKKMRITKNGQPPERKITPEERDFLYNDNRAIDKLMTEREAALLSVSPICPEDLKEFSRDTTFVSVLESVFKDEAREKTRRNAGATIDFHPDSLRYVPFSKILTKLDTGSVTNDDLIVPTLLISMPHPMNKELKKDSVTFSIGDTKSGSLRESWEK
jgi:hypothetical protein